MVTQSYNLNLVPGDPIKIVDVSQYDTDSRNIVFSLFSGREKFNVPESATITCDGTKKDGKGFSHECAFADNKVTLIPTEDMTAVGGDAVCQITIEDSGKILGTANFILRVERAALGDGTNMSPSEIAEAYDILKKAKDAVENTNSATDETKKATEEAKKAADLATEVAEHPNIPKNGTWWKWDAESDTYVDTHARAVLGIDKTYPSFDDMDGDKSNQTENTVAIIQSNVEDEDNAKLYIHNGSDWVYLADLSGFTGVGIERIELTGGDHSPGTTDTYTITLDNKQKHTFTVWNGATGPEGSAGPPGGVDSVDGMQGAIKTRLSFEVSLPAGSWTDGAQTVKDARFLTGDYDYIVDLAGQLSGADDVTEAGQMTFHADLVPSAAVTVKIVRLGVYIDE